MTPEPNQTSVNTMLLFNHGPVMATLEGFRTACLDGRNPTDFGFQSLYPDLPAADSSYSHPQHPNWRFMRQGPSRGRMNWLYSAHAVVPNASGTLVELHFLLEGENLTAILEPSTPASAWQDDIYKSWGRGGVR